MRRLEEENNRIFVDAYGLQDELTSEVPLEQITLTVNPAYRYGGDLGEAEQWQRFRRDTMAELLSYAIGCMMGRYSLDQPGLTLADSRASQVDHLAAYEEKVGKPIGEVQFKPDADAIIPVLDGEWFEDDIVARTREFLEVTFPESSVTENLRFIEESLGKDIRKYFCTEFYKDHLQTYKKRPIYWLFSSGKQGAFQALVYLHRYHEGTLARMRAEYVVPLTGKMQSRIEMLEKDKDAVSSTAARNKIAKQIESLKKKHVELLAYDEKLRHYADMRISLDLDDGVKVNYGKFGDRLDSVKAVTGGKDDV
jgi:type II restriction/modification system DNA methylase subunit YeeA